MLTRWFVLCFLSACDVTRYVNSLYRRFYFYITVRAARRFRLYIGAVGAALVVIAFLGQRVVRR